MRRMRSLIPAMFAAAIFVLANCGDSTPIAPQAPDSATPEVAASLTATISQVGAIMCSPVGESNARQVVGPAGGVIRVGGHRLVVPPGALSQSVTIRAKSWAGRKRAVTFEPHGLQFNTPVTLTMSYENCGFLATIVPKRIAYTDGDLTTVFEFLESLDLLRNSTVSARLDHFSDYVIFW